MGAVSHVLPKGRPLWPAGDRPAFLATPGLVTFTSGSMGRPKPVYITTGGFLLQAAAIISAFQLPRGCGIAASLPLAGHFGLGRNLMPPTVPGSPVVSQERFEHRSLLGLSASGRYSYWAGTPLMADTLRRAPLAAPLTSPPAVCYISGDSSRTISLPRAAAAQSGPKHILVVSLSNLARDPRVNRQIKELAGRFRVTAAGFADSEVAGVEFIQIPRAPRSTAGKFLALAMLKLGLFERFYWSSRSISSALQALGDMSFDLILANDVNTLPLACRLTSRHGIIFDAHEYSPREFEDDFLWRFLFQRYNEYLCRTYAGRAAGMLTVCQSIADEYRANYGVDPKVLTNAPRYHDLHPGRTDAGRIRMVHHGGATASRRIELMIETMDLVDERFHLDLMLVPGNQGYFERLVARAATRRSVRIVPPVPMEELPSRLNEYDIGLHLLPPNSLNHRYALPNKFFEFIQGRLAIAIGPSPEMARLVRQYDCGIVAEDFSPRTLAARLNELDAGRIQYYKGQSDRAARDLCFEKNRETLLAMIGGLAGSA